MASGTDAFLGAWPAAVDGQAGLAGARRCVRCAARCDGAALSVSSYAASVGRWELVFSDDCRAMPSAGVCGRCVEACEAAGTPLLEEEAVGDRLRTLREAAKKARRWMPENPDLLPLAGLVFPPGVALRGLEGAAGDGARVSDEAAVFTAAVLEYITAEIVELAGSCAQAKRRRTIKPQDVATAVHHDEELSDCVDLVVGNLADERLEERRRGAEAEAADAGDADANADIQERAVARDATLLLAASRGDTAGVEAWLRFVEARKDEFADDTLRYQRFEEPGRAPYEEPEAPYDVTCATPFEAAVSGWHRDTVALLEAAGARPMRPMMEADEATLEAMHLLDGVEPHLPEALASLVSTFASDDAREAWPFPAASGKKRARAP